MSPILSPAQPCVVNPTEHILFEPVPPNFGAAEQAPEGQDDHDSAAMGFVIMAGIVGGVLAFLVMWWFG